MSFRRDFRFLDTKEPVDNNNKKRWLRRGLDRRDLSEIDASAQPLSRGRAILCVIFVRYKDGRPGGLVVTLACCSAFVLEFKSHRGESLNLFANIKNDQLLRALAGQAQFGASRRGENRAEVFPR